MMKQCICCSTVKEINCFYKHKEMSDGHLNKCKDCCKDQQKLRLAKLSENEEWMEAERERGRYKYRRLNYKNRESSLSNKKINKSKYKNLSRDLKIPKDCEAHHWSYNEGFEYDIFIVKKTLHKKLHNFLIFDETTNCFITKDTLELLDTKEKHKNYFLSKGYKI